MKAVQRHDNSMDFIWALTKTFYYFIFLPCALILAAMTLFLFISGSYRYSLFTTDYFLLTFLWLSILLPLGVRKFSTMSRRDKLNKMVALLTSDERFSPQKQHQVLDAGRGKYLGIDSQRGTILYIHMVKKGIIDVMGLTMRDWTDREFEGSALRLYTKNPDVPVLSVNAHPIVTKDLFNTLGAMAHKNYGEPFPQEPWSLYVARQSKFVEFEHNVVVPQATA